MSDKIEELKQEYMGLCHGVQSGIAYAEAKRHRSLEPKHMRVGIDTTKADMGALVTLLIEKGVFTEEEWWTKAIEFMRREVESREYEAGPGVKFR